MYTTRSDGLEYGTGEVLARVGHRAVQSGKCRRRSVRLDRRRTLSVVARRFHPACAERRRQHFLDASRASEEVQIRRYAISVVDSTNIAVVVTPFECGLLDVLNTVLYSPYL